MTQQLNASQLLPFNNTVCTVHRVYNPFVCTLVWPLVSHDYRRWLRSWRKTIAIYIVQVYTQLPTSSRWPYTVLYIPERKKTNRISAPGEAVVLRYVLPWLLGRPEALYKESPANSNWQTRWSSAVCAYNWIMIATLSFILWGSLQLAILCSAVPLERRTVMQLPTRFDAGLVNSCEIPAANFCSVDYSVPTSVARLTLVIEEEIRNRYKEDKAGKGLECAQALRDIRCAQRFPQCSADSTQVTLSSLNCAERMSVCSGNIQTMLQEEGFCTLNGTSVIGECRPVTEYGYQFRHCPMSSDSWYVTRWMHDVMRHADVKLTAQFNGSTLGSTNPECRRKYATYFCQFMGRCTSHEEPRVEVVNTYEMCEEAINW